MEGWIDYYEGRKNTGIIIAQCKNKKRLKTLGCLFHEIGISWLHLTSFVLNFF